MSKLRGRRASKSGIYGESIFKGLLDAAGYNVTHVRDYDGSTPAAITQYPVPHPFRPDTVRAGRNDCMLETGVKRVYCQVKNQDGSGTTDEKLAFSFDIARYALSDSPYDIYALVLLGTWWNDRPGIVEWATRKCTEFEMLAGCQRREVSACVVVGPEQAATWIRSLPTRQVRRGLFQ